MALSRRALSLVACLSIAGCGSAPDKVPQKPSHAELVAHESELLKLSLTAEAQRRIGIATVRVGRQVSTQTRKANGEIVVPPDSAAALPASGGTSLAQLATQQVAADAEVSRARAQLRLARIAHDRAAVLVREEAGSVRARDEAAGALAAAQAALDAAHGQRRLLGPAVAAMNGLSKLWVRVPVFGSDIPAIARGNASVQPLGSTDSAHRVARPVQAPPSSSAAAGTVDLFFAIDNRDRAYRVGQRVSVELPIGAAIDGLSVPSSAIVRDIYGGEWVYRKTGADSFVRQRIESGSARAGITPILRGLSPDAEVVTVGAAELFGTEFGVAH